MRVAPGGGRVRKIKGVTFLFFTYSVMVIYLHLRSTVRAVCEKDLRIVRTLRTENGFTDRTSRTVRKKDLRVVNIVFKR